MTLLELVSPVYTPEIVTLLLEERITFDFFIRTRGFCRAHPVPARFAGPTRLNRRRASASTATEFLVYIDGGNDEIQGC